MKKKIIIIFILLILLLSFIYLNTYYKAIDVDKYLKNNNDVEVLKIKEGYYFDGDGGKDVIIFYPGAKVEYISYAPLMNKLAKEGIDTILLEMPFNIAFFDMKAANRVIDKYKYDNYYIMGHSLGGVVATSINIDKVKGYILLASYSTNKIENERGVLSIYGDKDKVLNMKEYNKNRVNLPLKYKEVVIKGGNHANFGDYGRQKKDGKASISRDKQQSITVKEIKEFLYN